MIKNKPGYVNFIRPNMYVIMLFYLGSQFVNLQL